MPTATPAGFQSRFSRASPWYSADGGCEGERQDAPPHFSECRVHPARANRIAVILAGGMSRRFGSDKALAKIGRETFLERLARMLTRLSFDVYVSAARRDDYPAYAVVADRLPRQGPLQALHTAFVTLRCPRLLLVGCDMPFVSPKTILTLWHADAEADVCLAWDGLQDYPLPAVYSERAWAEAGRLIAAGKRDLKSLLQRGLKVKRCSGVDAASLWNINTPKEYALCLPAALGSGPAESGSG